MVIRGCPRFPSGGSRFLCARVGRPRLPPAFPVFLCIFGPPCKFLSMVFFVAVCATCPNVVCGFAAYFSNNSIVFNFTMRGSAGSQQLRRGSPQPSYWPACVGGASKATQRRWRPRRRRFASVRAPAWRRECAWFVRMAREHVAEAAGRRLRQAEGDGAPDSVGKGRRRL